MKKKKKKVIPSGNRKLLNEYMSVKHGMQPYNAAIKAGYSDQFAKGLQDKMKAKAMFGYSYVDIAEQEGWTPRKSMRMMIEKAGHVEGVTPVQKVISAQVIVQHPDPTIKILKANSRTTDFIEVPDEDLILKYENKLWEITGLKDDNSEGNNNKDNTFNLIINLNSGDSPQTLEIPK